MPKRVPPLSDVQVKSAKPKERDYKLSDGGGLYLLVTTTGGKLWRIDYRLEGKRKTLACGTYPATSLVSARKKRESVREQVEAGIDPGELRKADREAERVALRTFEAVALEWYGKNEPVWSPGHAVTVKSRLERDVFPQIGGRPVSEVAAAEVRAMLQKVEARGAVDTALRIKIIVGQVFRYGVGNGYLEHDPSASLKSSEIFQKRKAKHHAAITDPKALAPLLRALDEYQGSFVVRCALQLTPLLFVRPGELQRMEWAEIDLEGEQWNIPAEKMKMKHPHVVPLARQAAAILKELRPLTGAGQYVFPGRTSSRPMSNNTVNAALRYLGFDKDTVTGHGFRATARTILDEVLHQRPDYIEHQLAHAVKDPNGRAYNRTAHLQERGKMMQLWADYLDGLKQGAKVIPMRRTA